MERIASRSSTFVKIASTREGSSCGAKARLIKRRYASDGVSKLGKRSNQCSVQELRRWDYRRTTLGRDLGSLLLQTNCDRVGINDPEDWMRGAFTRPEVFVKGRSLSSENIGSWSPGVVFGRDADRARADRRTFLNP